MSAESDDIMPRNRKRMSSLDYKAVRGRFGEYVKKAHGSWPKFGNAMGIRESTWKGWERKTKGSLPNLATLVVIARRSALNLHWLLTGDGPMLRPNDVSTPEGQLIGVMEGYLRSFEGAEPHEALQVWAKMSILVDDETGLPGIFRAALEGVRPVYRRLLAEYRDFDRVQGLVAGWTPSYVRGEVVGSEEWNRRIEQLVEAVSAQVRSRGEKIVVNGPEPLLLRPPKPVGDPPWAVQRGPREGLGTLEDKVDALAAEGGQPARSEQADL
jgi:hypothetical protein